MLTSVFYFVLSVLYVDLSDFYVDLSLIHMLENKSKLLMNRNLKDLLKSTLCSHLQIIKTVCQIKFEIFKIIF